MTDAKEVLESIAAEQAWEQKQEELINKQVRRSELDAVWFTDMSGTIGIVRTQYDSRPVSDRTKYHIGRCQNGNSEIEDIRFIIEWGANFPKAAGDALFKSNL